MKNTLIKYLLAPLTIILILINFSEVIASEREEVFYFGSYLIVEGGDHGSNAVVVGIRAKNIFMETYVTNDDITAAAGLYEEIGDYRLSVGVTNFNDFGAVVGLDYKWFSMKVIQYTAQKTRKTMYGGSSLPMTLHRGHKRDYDNHIESTNTLPGVRDEVVESSEVMIWIGGTIDF